MLIDVVRLVGGGEDLRFVEVVDAQLLQHLGLHEVADAALGHDGDGDGVHDAGDDLRVRHAGNAAGGADVRGHALQSHDGAGAGVLGDLGLLRGDDVHDDAALEHLGQAALDGNSAGLDCHRGATSRWVQYTRKGKRGQGTRTIKGFQRSINGVSVSDV